MAKPDSRNFDERNFGKMLVKALILLCIVALLLSRKALILLGGFSYFERLKFGDFMDICLVPDGKFFTLFVRFNIFFLIIENNGSLWNFYLLHVINNFQLASKM